jgi:hypothetical protein
MAHAILDHTGPSAHEQERNVITNDINLIKMVI